MKRINKTLVGIALATLLLGGVGAATAARGLAGGAADFTVFAADTIDPAENETPEFLPREVRDTTDMETEEQRTYEAQIHLLARSYGDSIVLRWAAEDFASWQYLNTVGVNVLRMPLSDDISFDFDTLAYRLKPASLEQWKTIYPTVDSVAYLAMGALYGAGGLTQDQTYDGEGEMGALLSVYQDQQYRYGMALMASEWRKDVANHLAMRFVDRTVKPGHRYSYIVRPAVFDSTGTLPIRSGFIEDIKNDPYKAESYTVAMRDSVVGINQLRLSWPQTTRFSAYDVYRRPMGGGAWKKVNSKPFMMSRDTEGEDLDNFINDNVPGPGTYEYRVAGYDAFGDYVTAENDHVATMPDIDAPRPPVLQYIEIDRRNDNDLAKDVFATFHFKKDTLEADFVGFKVLYYQRSHDEESAKWIVLTPELLGVNDTVCTLDMTGLATSQVAVAAYDTAQNVSYSMTHLIRLADVEAPEAPRNFRYEVLDNAEGTIRLSWSAPSADVDYYEIAFANDTTHQFMLRQIPGDSLLRDTSFVDTLAVDVNQKYIYYKVRAIDYATNEGDYSPVLQVLRPSMVQPGVAHLDSAWVDQTKGIRMRWVCSNEQQVSHHVLMRRLGNSKKPWDVIGVYNGDSLAAAGNMVDVTDVPEAVRGQRYEYAMETFTYAGISSGLSLVYSARFEGEIVFEWPIRLFGDYDASKQETKIAWETDEKLPYKGEWYYCIFRKGKDDKRFKFLISAGPGESTWSDYLLSKGESAEYYVIIQYADGRSSHPSNTVKVTAPAENK